MSTGSLTCGLAFNYHDSSVSFAEGQSIVLSLEAERVFRRKKMHCTAAEMEDLIAAGLQVIGRSVDDVEFWALATLENPWLEDELKQPTPPKWIDTRILGRRARALVVNHHLAHASMYLLTTFDEATVVTCDGGGDCGERVTVYKGRGNVLEKVLSNPVGWVTAKPYDLVSTFLYGAPRCEGKLMALAALGDVRAEYVNSLRDIEPELCVTDYQRGIELLTKTFPAMRGAASANNESCRDLAASLQHYFAERRLADIKRAITEFPSESLCMAGGACLNLEVNTRLWEEYPEKAIYTPPCCDDTGQSLGALAYLVTSLTAGRPKVTLPYLGYGMTHCPRASESTLDRVVSSLLKDQIVLIHNGKAEIGPRALGNRSFIARPDSLAVKRRLSESIKRRESYRPLAPIGLHSCVGPFFRGPLDSQFMLHQYTVVESKRQEVIGAVHCDGTARLQTVTEDQNPFMARLLEKWEDATGTPVLLNTSLNRPGEPISNDLDDTRAISATIPEPHEVVYNGGLLT